MEYHWAAPTLGGGASSSDGVSLGGGAASSDGVSLGGGAASSDVVSLGGGAASSDVLRLALKHFHSFLRRKVAVAQMKVVTIAIPICFGISYKCELLLKEPGGGGTARDGVGRSRIS
jgi:hypothetical protein